MAIFTEFYYSLFDFRVECRAKRRTNFWVNWRTNFWAGCWAALGANFWAECWAALRGDFRADFRAAFRIESSRATPRLAHRADMGWLYPLELCSLSRSRSGASLYAEGRRSLSLCPRSAQEAFCRHSLN